MVELKDAFELLLSEETEQVIPVVKFSFPPQRCYVIDEKQNLRYKWPENQPKRSQDLEPFYHDAGQFYFYDARVFYQYKNTVDLITKALVLTDLEVQDIDTFEDWAIAEMKYQLMGNKE